MKLTQSVMLVVALAFSLGASAGPITFMSSVDDVCKPSGPGVTSSCSGLTDLTAGSYVDPTGTDLDGAEWVQADDSWKVVGTYRVWEVDLAKNGQDNYIESLFVSYDDKLTIRSDGNVLFDSSDYSISKPWKKVIDVIDLVGGPLFVASNKRLNFYVENTGGPTGVIWKGTAVSEPGTLALLGLGAFGLVAARRRKQA